MQGGQSMEEVGVRERPRPTRAKSHKEDSLLDPPRPRPQASFTQHALSCTALGQPSLPPASAAELAASPLTPVHLLRLLRTPLSHTPLLPAGRGPPTALPGGGCRSPSAIFSVKSRRGCSQFPLSFHPAPFPGSTKLPEGKRAPAGYDRKPRIRVTLLKAAAMPVRGTQRACPATAVSRPPRRQTAAAILVRGAGSMRTNGCRPLANCRSDVQGHQSDLLDARNRLDSLGGVRRRRARAGPWLPLVPETAARGLAANG
ncbi:hypothetical protein LEMLEM_LOCUS9265 [Lemmus lemmus]